MASMVNIHFLTENFLNHILVMCFFSVMGCLSEKLLKGFLQLTITLKTVKTCFSFVHTRQSAISRL